MSIDQTSKLPLEIKTKILSMTDQRTITMAAHVSKEWRRASNRFFNEVKIYNISIPAELARDIDLAHFTSRLRVLFKRKANELAPEILHIITAIKDPAYKLEEIGLFYPYTKKEDVEHVNRLIGIQSQHPESKPTRRPRSVTIKNGHEESNHDAAQKKTKMLDQACWYGNTQLFLLLMTYGATPTLEHLNLAAKSGNTFICTEIMRKVKPDLETLYYALLTANAILCDKIFEKNRPIFKEMLRSPKHHQAAQASRDEKTLQNFEEFQAKFTKPKIPTLRKRN